MARNYANAQQQNQEVMDSLHRRVNTEAPHAGRLGDQEAPSQYPRQNILVDDDRQGGPNRQRLQNNDHLPGDDDDEEEIDDEMLGLEGIDAEQLRQMMSDPRYAALFAAHYGGMQYMRTENGNRDEYGYEDDDGGQYIDLNNLPEDQHRYFLHGGDLNEGHEDDDCEEDEEEDDGGMRGIVGRGNGEGFFAEGDEDEGTLVHFRENASQLQQRFEYDEEGRMLPEAESDYCEDLAEVYIHNGSQEDVNRYKAIHLLDKGANYNVEDGGEKFQCGETGAHFEFLEMCRRLKRLQTLRVTIDKVLTDEDVKRKAAEAAAAAKLAAQQQQQQLRLQQQQQQQQQLLLQQQQQQQQQQLLLQQKQQEQMSPVQTRQQQQQYHQQRLESGKRVTAESSSQRPSNAAAPAQPRLQIKQVDATLYLDKPHPTENTQQETVGGVYQVYGTQQPQRPSQGALGKGILSNSHQKQASVGLTAQQHHVQFQTEVAHQQQRLSTEDDEQQQRLQQMVLMAPGENDEDEIVDLLHDQKHHRAQGSVSKLSQQQQQRKPPITGSTQKKPATTKVQKQLFQTDGQQLCFTEVEERPSRAQQIAYNNFFKLGPNEQAAQQQHRLQQANHGKRNQQLDIKTQKDLDLMALSQQFIEQHQKGTAAPFSNSSSTHHHQRNNQQQQHQFATQSYFTTNQQYPAQQQQPQQRASKRQASAGGIGSFMSVGSKPSLTGASKKTRTGSTSQAFNSHYSGAGSNTNNRGNSSGKFHVPPQAAAPPIVMVMNPSKQTQIQNILMNFYQNTNSRASHHNYDHRVYPTKVSNKHSATASIVGSKGYKQQPQQQQQHILVSSDVVMPPSQSSKVVSTSSHQSSSHHQQQFKSQVQPQQQQQYSSNAVDRKNVITIQKLHNKQLVLKKPGMPQHANTIESSHMQMGSQPQMLQHQQQNITSESITGSRPQSAIKKKSTGISPNSKLTSKQIYIGRQTGSKQPKGGAYKYDALNPKYIQFKSRDQQHKKTNSFSLGGLTAAFSSYNKGGKTKIQTSGDQYHNHQQQQQQLYTTVESVSQSQSTQPPQMMTSSSQFHHGGTFINDPQQDSACLLGGTPSSGANGTKRSMIMQQPGTSQGIYEASPPTQKQKNVGISHGSGSNMKIIGSTSSKSRQPNHIVSCGGIISSKILGSNNHTVQDSSLKMDMNAIIKKLAVNRKHDMNQLVQNVAATFDQAESKHSRYGQQYQNPVSFAGKKITVAGQGQQDPSKRLSVNIQGGSKMSVQQPYQQQQQQFQVNGKVRNSSQGKSKGGLGLGSNNQTRHSSVVPQSHQQYQQSKSSKRINHQITGSMVPQSNGQLFASNKKSNRVSSGISYDYRSSEWRCDTVS